MFIFGVLAYLTFLNQGGLAGEVLLIYVSALPMTMAIELVRLARAGQKLGAHHIVKGVLTGVVLCGLGGLWVLFPYQIAWGLAGTMAFVWVTMYSPASPILKPPTLRDLTASAPSREGQTLRSITMLAGAVVLLVGGIALTGLAVI
ncbi:MAG TPA: hypothetical protein VHQ03_05725, partial [Candidatus Dormibacteraeota bacterium]|nr:hypothetical protein [Candidatus Dormibacteraeota bacterium]